MIIFENKQKSYVYFFPTVLCERWKWEFFQVPPSRRHILVSSVWYELTFPQLIKERNKRISHWKKLGKKRYEFTIKTLTNWRKWETKLFLHWSSAVKVNMSNFDQNLCSKSVWNLSKLVYHHNNRMDFIYI